MDVYEMISEIGKDRIADLLDCVLLRYKKLYPNWDIFIITLDKTTDKNEQLDKMIDLIQNMKE